MALAANNERSLWASTAGYLYVLRLSPEQWAWEYLRRNEDYRAASRNGGIPASSWGLSTYVDANRDARGVHPPWSSTHAPVLITALDTPAAHAFDLWGFAGAKDLSLDAGWWSLSIQGLSQTHRVILDGGIVGGEPFGYVIPASQDLDASCRAVRDLAARYGKSQAPLETHQTKRSCRDAIFHARALQALDAVAAGVTHRQIAEVLFGADRTQRLWRSESDLRAQVRYLIKRGQTLCAGGYRSLLP